MDEHHVESTERVTAARTALSWTYLCFSTLLWTGGVILYYLVVVIVFVLKLLYRPVAFLLLPFVYLGRFVFVCLAAPFRLLAKLETVYIYLGVAAIVGVAVGLLVSYTYGSLHKVLRLDAEAATPARSAREYRETKRKQKTKAEAPFISAGPLSPNGISSGYLSVSDGTRKIKHGKGLLGQTILEEVDSDY